MFPAFLSWRRQRRVFIKLDGKKRFDSSSEQIWGSQTLRVPARPPPQQLGCDDVTQRRRWAQRPEGLTLLSSPASPSPALAISYGSPLPATAAPRCGSEPLICPQRLLCTCCLSSSTNRPPLSPAPPNPHAFISCSLWADSSLYKSTWSSSVNPMNLREK